MATKRKVAKVGEMTKKGKVRVKAKRTPNQIAYLDYVKKSGCLKGKGVKRSIRAKKCADGWDKVAHKPKK